jgi:thioredoxin 1
VAKPFEVSDASFEEKVLQAGIPTLVDFWAVWCQPCTMIAPVLAEMADELDGQLQVAKLDVDHNPDTAMQYGVMSIPTLILFKEGKAVERLVGFLPKKHLQAKIRAHL